MDALGRRGARAIPSASAPIVAEGHAAPGHIFNLGHGVLPTTDPGVITAVTERVHQQPAAPVG